MFVLERKQLYIPRENLTKNRCFQGYRWAQIAMCEEREPLQKMIPKVELENRLPVVRCRECKHYRNHPNGLCYAHTEPDDNERGYKGEAVCVEPEDFCSYGEKRSDFVDDNKIGERRADE